MISPWLLSCLCSTSMCMYFNFDINCRGNSTISLISFFINKFSCSTLENVIIWAFYLYGQFIPFSLSQGLPKAIWVYNENSGPFGKWRIAWGYFWGLLPNTIPLLLCHHSPIYWLYAQEICNKQRKSEKSITCIILLVWTGGWLAWCDVAQKCINLLFLFKAKLDECFK